MKCLFDFLIFSDVTSATYQARPEQPTLLLSAAYGPLHVRCGCAHAYLLVTTVSFQQSEIEARLSSTSSKIGEPEMIPKYSSQEFLWVLAVKDGRVWCLAVVTSARPKGTFILNVLEKIGAQQSHGLSQSRWTFSVWIQNTVENSFEIAHAKVTIVVWALPHYGFQHFNDYSIPALTLNWSIVLRDHLETWISTTGSALPGCLTYISGRTRRVIRGSMCFQIIVM